MRRSRVHAFIIFALAVSTALVIDAGCPAEATAATLRRDTVAAFGHYVDLTEARINGDLASSDRSLWLDRLSESERRETIGRLQHGATIVSRMQTRDAGRDIEIPGGLSPSPSDGDDLCALTPASIVSRAAGCVVLRDVSRDVYRPGGPAIGKVLSRRGDATSRSFSSCSHAEDRERRYSTPNTTYWTTSVRPGRMSVRSISTRIAEVRQADGPEPREAPVGDDEGFLWRLNSYWTLEERNGGAYVQCESVSLSRGIPVGLGWLIDPFDTTVPKDSHDDTHATMRRTLTEGPTP